MIKLILLLLLTGCAETQVVLPLQEAVEQSTETDIAIPVTKYRVGQCLYLIDHVTGKGNSKDILIVDNITKTKYIYRWWIYWTNSWALDTNDGIGEFKLFERMTKDIKCPV